jgi:hypothetical protein
MTAATGVWEPAAVLAQVDRMSDGVGQALIYRKAQP